jgi:hypothetical protein
VLWYTLLSWARFQPRLNNHRQTPGSLFCPAEYSHVFQKYWDNIESPIDHPEFANETSHTRESMKLYTLALSSLDCSDYIPPLHAGAKDSDVRIASDAAVGRLLPIPDGVDLWLILEGRSSPATGRCGFMEPCGALPRKCLFAYWSRKARPSPLICTRNGWKRRS